jgi:hypothetical protein
VVRIKGGEEGLWRGQDSRQCLGLSSQIWGEIKGFSHIHLVHGKCVCMCVIWHGWWWGGIRVVWYGAKEPEDVCDELWSVVFMAYDVWLGSVCAI